MKKNRIHYYEDFRSYIDLDGLLYIPEEDKGIKPLLFIIREYFRLAEILVKYYLPDYKILKIEDQDIEYLKNEIEAVKAEIIRRKNGTNTDTNLSEIELIEQIETDERMLEIATNMGKDVDLIDRTLKSKNKVFIKGKGYVNLPKEEKNKSLGELLVEKVEETKESDLPLEYQLDEKIAAKDRVTQKIEEFRKLDDGVKTEVMEEVVAFFFKRVDEEYQKHKQMQCVCNGHTFGEPVEIKDLVCLPHDESIDYAYRGRHVYRTTTCKICTHCGFKEISKIDYELAELAGIHYHYQESDGAIRQRIIKDPSLYKNVEY